MASINFNVGKTRFIFEGTVSIRFEQFDDFVHIIREWNEDGDFPGIPEKSIWSSYFPGFKGEQDILNRIHEFKPGREYEVDAKVPFTLEY